MRRVNIKKMRGTLLIFSFIFFCGELTSCNEVQQQPQMQQIPINQGTEQIPEIDGRINLGKFVGKLLGKNKEPKSINSDSIVFTEEPPIKSNEGFSYKNERRQPSHQLVQTPNPYEGTDQLFNVTSSSDDSENENDVCFPFLGCFAMGAPWKSVLRPVSAPQSPELIQAVVYFYSRDNINRRTNISLYPEINLNRAPFNSRKMTAIIVHGFASSGNSDWMKNMKDVYLKQVDANVMLVDWEKGSQLNNYFQVAGNTRVVGKLLATLVKHLMDNYNADPGKFHLIGHSLGAQICAYLGKDVPGISRLTALDPAQPGFEGFDKLVRLDKSDANFVDVVHTDAKPFLPTLGFGMIAPHGHVDFYMNGGFEQPGCIPLARSELPSINSIGDLAKYPVEVISKMVSCPHSRSYQYLIESFNETEKCIFWGHRADAKNILRSVANTLSNGLLKTYVALSSTCSKEDCTPLGLATRRSPLRGSFVVTTNALPPFCIAEPGVPPESPTSSVPVSESSFNKLKESQILHKFR